MTVRGKHRVRRGFDVRVAGAAAAEIVDLDPPELVAATLGPIPGARLRLLVDQGSPVCRGQPVMTSIEEPRYSVAAPATGRVVQARAAGDDHPPCVEIRCAPDGGDESHDVALPSADDAAGADRAQLAGRLRASGLWPLLRQRPGGGIAGPRPPAALFVNGMDTEPLAADPSVLLVGRERDFAHGLAIVRRLCDGPVYLAVGPDPPAFADVPDVERHEFSGPHPAGLAGTHINAIAPLRPGLHYWTVRAQDLARIGEAARTGALPARRLVAVAGPRAARPGYYQVYEGARLDTLIGAIGGDARIIQGTVLSGSAATPNDFLASTTHTVTVIRDGAGHRDLFGWLRPRFDRPSASRAVFGWFRPRAGYDVDARLHGEPRAIVNLGAWDKVMPLDVNVSYLVRAIQAGDLEEAVRFGLLDVIEEDVALCSYVDPCKLDVGAVIRRGLELYARREGGP